MIQYRPFLNTDPPRLADVWRSQPPLRGLAQAVTASILERLVFSKPYFDREGLIVADDGGRVLGFVHAGFGPDESRRTLSCQTGVVSRLLVVPHEERDVIARELLRRAEKYLIDRGSNTIYAGGVYPYTPFYLGLYGGSRLPGILEEDQQTLTLFAEHEYQLEARQSIHQCRLTGFRAPMNRHQVMVRRAYQIMAVIDPISETWWDACTLGQTDRTRFVLSERQSGDIHGQVTFWDIEPLSSNWGVHAMGMYDLQIARGHRRKGLATFLIGEALRQLQSQGITLAEVQFREDDQPSRGLFEGLGFRQMDRGEILKKSVRSH